MVKSSQHSNEINSWKVACVLGNEYDKVICLSLIVPRDVNELISNGSRILYLPTTTYNGIASAASVRSTATEIAIATAAG